MFTLAENVLMLSSFAWGYVAVLTVGWFRAVAQTDTRDHIGHFVSLMGVFVPGVSLFMVSLFLAAALQSGWIFLLVLLLMPAGFATGLHLEVNRLTDPDPWTEYKRLAMATVLGLFFIGSGMT
ncbi:MAG: hypothetical protein AAFX00_14415 [Pseudomonadota bacterium]